MHHQRHIEAGGCRSSVCCDNTTDGVGTQTVPLDGIGQAPLTFSPTSIAFSNQALGSTRGTQIVTLTNNTGVFGQLLIHRSDWS
jgi:hypothetical protein